MCKRRIINERCTVCGRFVSLKEERSGEIIRFYIPDTPFSIENTWVEYKKCTTRIKK